MADDGGCYVNKEKWITEKEWKLLKEVWLDWRRNGDGNKLFHCHFGTFIFIISLILYQCWNFIRWSMLFERDAGWFTVFLVCRKNILILQRFNVFALEFSKLMLSVQIIFYEEQLGQSYVCYTVVCI